LENLKVYPVGLNKIRDNYTAFGAAVCDLLNDIAFCSVYADRQADRQADTQADTHTHKLTHRSEKDVAQYKNRRKWEEDKKTKAKKRKGKDSR